VATCERDTCTGSIDEDGDGLTDCSDPDCSGEATCFEPSASCGDFTDNEGDGFTDCSDSDCTLAASCTESCVANGIDDEGDGLTDECDPACSGRALCTEADALCDNQIDDDTDGQTDCDDSTCAARPSCGGACPSFTLDAAPMSGSNAGAFARLTPPCSAASGRELTFAVSATSAGTHTFDTFGSDYDTVIYVRDGCDGVDLACNDDYRGSAQSAVSVVLGAGESVLVVLDAATPDGVGSYVLNVTRP